MAEALGLASGVVALVQLSASVYSATSKFYRGAKDAKSKIGALATQTRNLSGVLQSLSLLTSSPLFDDEGTYIPDFRETYIESCHITLYKIKRKLEKVEDDINSGSQRKLVTRSLKWPFASQETDDLIKELNNHQKVLELALSTKTVSELLQCLAHTKDIARSVDILNRKLDRKDSIDTRAKSTEKRDKVTRLFLKVNPEHAFQDCRSRRQPHTGKWLVEKDPVFRSWVCSPGSQIWLSGIPGAGKTILCGIVVEEMLQEQSTSTAVAYFFCDYKDPESQQPINIVAALAIQLAKQAEAAFELLEAYYEELHPQDRLKKPPQTKDMIKVVQSMIDQFDRVYVVVDGLDECGSNLVDVLQSLKQVTAHSSANMALFSRDEPDILEELSESSRIEISAHTDDLELYVFAQMENRKRLRSLAVKNPELHKHILRTLIEGANGMFRWVACQLDYLDGLPSDRRRRQALTELPPTLFETYDRILDRIMQEDWYSQELCRKALHWIALEGYNHLDHRALCEAISVPLDPDILDNEHLVEPDWISRRCSSLIRLAQHGVLQPHFQLAHFTVKEYLRSIKHQSPRSLFRFSENTAIQELLSTSLRFLTMSIFDRRPEVARTELRQIEERNRHHPFYPYAASNMFCYNNTHWNQRMNDQLSLLLEDEAAIQHVRKLFHPDKTGFFVSWALQFAWSRAEMSSRSDFFNAVALILAPEFSTLHVAAMLAMPSLCTFLIGCTSVDLNLCCQVGTPLHALLTGPDPLHAVASQLKATQYHRRDGSPDIPILKRPKQCLEMFLSHGADTSSGWDDTSIFQMALNNSVRTQYDKAWIQPLINTETMVNDDCISYFEPLFSKGLISRTILDAILSLRSSPHIPRGWARLISLIQIKRMENNDVPLDPRPRISDEDFMDGLRISLRYKLTDYLRIFVQDIRFRPDHLFSDEDDPTTILQLAVRQGCLESVQLLLDTGCNPNVASPGRGWTSLHQCAHDGGGYAEMTAILIKSGADASLEDTNGNSCWHIAASCGNTPVLKVLLKKSSGTKRLLTTASGQGRTPLACAIHNNKLESALLLLDQCGAEPKLFLSDQPLLDSAAGIGSRDLFLRLYTKLKKAACTEEIENSKPLEHIDINCSPDFVEYLGSVWTGDGTSIALTSFLLQASNPKPCYPSRTDFSRIFRVLLRPGHAYVDHGARKVHFWKTFCTKVVTCFIKDRDHTDSQDRSDWICFIFQLVIDNGLLISYERGSGLPGCRVLFQELLKLRDHLAANLKWIPHVVRMVVQAYSLSRDLVIDSTYMNLFSWAVETSSPNLARGLLHHGADVHSVSGSLSPLERACISGQEIFEMVLPYARKPLLNKAGSKGKTPLHWAVSSDSTSWFPGKVEQLLQLGADIDAVIDDANGDTALTLVSRKNQQDRFALLVSKGAKITHRARDGWSALHAAAKTGQLRYIQSLIPKKTPRSFWMGGCNSPFTDLEPRLRSIEKMTAIHLAAFCGKSHVLEYLLHKKYSIHNQVPFDVNATTGFSRRTPLHFACLSGDLTVVKDLISHKADANVRDAYGMLAIDIAAGGGHAPIVKKLLESGSTTPSRNYASAFVSHLMSTGTDVKDDDVKSQFYFENAIVHGDLRFCQNLVGRGHSVNKLFLSCTYTPLVRALIERQERIVDWLVSIEVNASNPNTAKLHPSLRCVANVATHFFTTKETLRGVMRLAVKQNVSWYGAILGPIHVAVLDNNMEALHTILKHIRENEVAYRRMIEDEAITLPDGFSVWRNRSALSILVNEFNHEDALFGSPPWRQRMPPGSPLHWAVREGNVSAVKLLIRNDADVNQLDSLGDTPLHLAVSNGNAADLLRELIQSGAGLAEPSRCRLDAMRLAVRSGDLEVVKILAEVDQETLKAVDQLSANNLLHIAGSVEVFQYLISQGADPFNADSPSSSALALQLNKPLFRDFVFNSGLTSHFSEESTAIAFTTAAVSNNLCVIKRMYHTLPRGVFDTLVNRSKYGMGSPLCLAASTNAAELVQDLIAMGARIDSEGCRYGSPLMAACVWGSLDAVKCLVRSGAALRYVNEEGLLRSSVRLSSRHQNIMTWLLVDRHIEQRKLEYQPAVSRSHHSAWSGPRLFRLALPEYYVHRDFGESQWDHLLRLQNWKKSLLGITLAESRRNSGLAFDAEIEAERRARNAQAAHRGLLARLGEDLPWGGGVFI